MKESKMSKEVFEFLRAYENSCKGFGDWKEFLLVHHIELWEDGKITEGHPMYDVSPLELAAILINEYEDFKFTAEGLPKHFEVIDGDRVTHIQDMEDDNFMCMFIESGKIRGYIMYVDDVLDCLNSGEWEVVGGQSQFK